MSETLPTAHCGEAPLHTGAHKINHVIGQVLLAKRMGPPRIIAETDAGQHGVAASAVCAKFGFKCRICMGSEVVGVEEVRKTLRALKMEL